MSIAEAIGIIKAWHSFTHKEVKSVEYDFEVVNYNEQVRKEIEEERLADDRVEFSTILESYVKEYTDASLFYSYLDVIRFLAGNIYALVFKGNLELSCWSFIREDYGVVNRFLEEYDRQLRQVVEHVGEADEDESMGLTLLGIKEEFIEEDGVHP
jgi:hypothetical protein